MRTPLKPCPKPDKHAYHTRGEALASMVVSASTRAHRPYHCCCGRWHITSQVPITGPYNN